MESKDYDVFISYRRENGREIARTLQLALMQRGLKVFFDLEEIRDGKFNEALYESIDKAKSLIVIMTTGALDKCVNDDDWVRLELEHAVRKGVDVIPVLPSGHNLNFPRGLPSSLSGLAVIQAAELNLNTLFNASVDQLVQRLKSVKASSHSRGDYTLIDPDDVTRSDVEGTISLDHRVYSDEYIPSCDRICQWTEVNPDIDFIVRDNDTHEIVAYAEAMPVTNDCYEDLRSGKIVDMDLMEVDKILSYDMPGAYDVYFASIVIHPQHRRAGVLTMLLNEMVRRYICLMDNEVFVRRILADAISPIGEKFCQQFGMKRIDASNHSSTLYEVSLMPPRFKPLSRSMKELFDKYACKYAERSWMFDENEITTIP